MGPQTTAFNLIGDQTSGAADGARRNGGAREKRLGRARRPWWKIFSHLLHLLDAPQTRLLRGYFPAPRAPR
jgi:hypothetical protein